jgi:hypothetical protein
MEKLTPKNINLQVEIFTPIHIHNNEVMDRMNYFFREGFEALEYANSSWLVDCARMNRELFDKIIKSIEN